MSSQSTDQSLEPSNSSTSSPTTIPSLPPVTTSPQEISSSTTLPLTPTITTEQLTPNNFSESSPTQDTPNLLLQTTQSENPITPLPPDDPKLLLLNSIDERYIANNLQYLQDYYNIFQTTAQTIHNIDLQQVNVNRIFKNANCQAKLFFDVKANLINQERIKLHKAFQEMENNIEKQFNALQHIDNQHNFTNPSYQNLANHHKHVRESLQFRLSELDRKQSTLKQDYEHHLSTIQQDYDTTTQYLSELRDVASHNLHNKQYRQLLKKTRSNIKDTHDSYLSEYNIVYNILQRTREKIKDYTEQLSTLQDRYDKKTTMMTQSISDIERDADVGNVTNAEREVLLLGINEFWASAYAQITNHTQSLTRLLMDLQDDYQLNLNYFNTIKARHDTTNVLLQHINHYFDLMFGSKSAIEHHHFNHDTVVKDQEQIDLENDIDVQRIFILEYIAQQAKFFEQQRENIQKCKDREAYENSLLYSIISHISNSINSINPFNDSKSPPEEEKRETLEELMNRPFSFNYLELYHKLNENGILPTDKYEEYVAKLSSLQNPPNHIPTTEDLKSYDICEMVSNYTDNSHIRSYGGDNSTNNSFTTFFSSPYSIVTISQISDSTHNSLLSPRNMGRLLSAFDDEHIFHQYYSDDEDGIVNQFNDSTNNSMSGILMGETSTSSLPQSHSL